MEDNSLIGKQLGKYELETEIGRGGMGVVYRGYDPLLDRHVAVKVLAPHLVWQKEFVERFLREARAAARLKHPGIVTIYDVGQEGGWYYFVMEYLEGQSLTERIYQHGEFSPAEVIDILLPLAEALDYAHHHGLVHRDIKPGNVIVSPDGHVTLTDFGIARAAQETRMTGTGTVMGTPEYMSPEQAKGLSVGARSDQYSLAVMAYEMLSGEVPFQADSTLALMYKVVHEPPQPIHQIRPNLPEGVTTVLVQALAKEPGARFGTVTAFVENLRRALAGEAVEPSPIDSEDYTVSEGTATKVLESEHAAEPAPAPMPPPDRSRRKIWLGALGGLVALVLLAVGILALGGGGGDEDEATPTVQGVEKETAAVAAVEASSTPSTTPKPTVTKATETPTPRPTSTPMTEAACVYDVELVETVDPYNFWYANSNPTFDLVLRNTGTCAWPEGSKLVLVTESELDWPESWSVDELAEDETKEVEIELVAPGTSQTFELTWRLQGPDGEFFGEAITRTLEIRERSTPAPTPYGGAIYLPSELDGESPAQVVSPRVRALSTISASFLLVGLALMRYKGAGLRKLRLWQLGKKFIVDRSK